MSLSVFPSTVRGLTYSVLKVQEFSTLIQTAPNMVETRLSQTQNPIWHWELLYEVLFDQPNNLTTGLFYTDLKTMIGFLASLRGKYDDFLYLDPDDNFVGPGVVGGLPNLQAQLQVVNDGAGNYYSPLQIYRGGQFWEDVTDTNGQVTVFENGVPSSAFISYGWGGFSVPGASFSGIYISWGTHVPTQPVTATFNYYYRVHLEEDKQDFEKFVNQLWTVGGSESVNSSGAIKFMSSRGSSPVSASACPSLPSAPPIGFPAGATNFQVLWPSTLVTVNGTGAGGVPANNIGWAGGVAGVNACGVAELIFQGLGSSGGSCTFSGWSGPTNIPLSLVKAVYVWCPYIHSGGTSGTAFASISFRFNGSPVGGALSTRVGTFLTAPAPLTANLVRLDTSWGGTIATFPYASIQTIIGLLASINGFYYDFVRGRPMVLVYY